MRVVGVVVPGAGVVVVEVGESVIDILTKFVMRGVSEALQNVWRALERLIAKICDEVLKTDWQNE